MWTELVQTFGEAVNEIEPKLANNGEYSLIWIEWANLYYEQDDFKNMN